MSRIYMYDRGDMSVGIRPAHVEITTNFHVGKDEYESYYVGRR